jgi:hypothetical protein
MNLEHKRIKQTDLTNFLMENNGKLLVDTESDYVKLYECDNNMLVVENIKAKQITLYFDRNRYFKSKAAVIKKSDLNPLKSMQIQILGLPNSKTNLINELFDSLKITPVTPLSAINLKTFNNAIKKYGYDKAIQNLYVNIIVFAGEYVKEYKGGHWVIKKSKQYPNYCEPIFIDETGIDYSFWLNHSILKDFNTKDSFNIEKLLEFSLLPNFIKS